MVRAFDPPDVPKPASAYSQAVLHDMPARRLVISGQIGVSADGTVRDGFDAQARQALANLEAILRAADMVVGDLVRITVFVTQPGVVARWRVIRDEALRGHKPASTYLMVAGLAHPDFLVEVEGEAIQEIRR